MMDDLDYRADMERADWAAECERDKLEAALAESRAEVERLDAECRDRIRQALENGNAYHEQKARAERLAGALREVRDEASKPGALNVEWVIATLDAALEQEPQE